MPACKRPLPALLCLAALLSASALAEGAHAEEPAAAPPGGNTGTAPQVSVELGAAALALPRYPGADSTRLLAFPDISVTLGDVFFASFASGIGARVHDRDGLALGVLARPDFGRRASDSQTYLHGLGKVDASAELGGFADLHLAGPLSLRSEVRKAIGGHDGVVADLALTWARPLGPRLFLALSSGLRLTDARYMRAYYGVTPAAALVSGLAVDQPGAGLERVGLRATLVRRLGPRLGLQVAASFDRLVGDAARSPIVRMPAGSPSQPGALVSLRYHF